MVVLRFIPTGRVILGHTIPKCLCMLEENLGFAATNFVCLVSGVGFSKLFLGAKQGKEDTTSRKQLDIECVPLLPVC